MILFSSLFLTYSFLSSKYKIMEIVVKKERKTYSPVCKSKTLSEVPKISTGSTFGNLSSYNTDS